MKLAIVATTLVCSASTAAAFMPSSSSVRSGSRLAAGDLWEPEPTKQQMSQALPFVQRPKMLDGTLPGDVGFDPFGFGGDDKPSLLNMREAEIKHSRLAMLAVVGWPLAELFDKNIADLAGLPAALTKTGESPSVLNGGLDRIDTLYWVAVVALAGIVEIENQKVKDTKGKTYTPGDCSFDPLGLYPKDGKSQFEMQTKEIKHGRLAMMAIFGFVVQEALYGVPVIQQTPFFFSPVSLF